MSSLNMGNTALLFNIILSIYILFSFTVTQSAPESALVTELPGFDGTFPSKHYSRYVPIVGTSEKKLFYYFVLSERNTLEDPVVLWLNGWPGCSSFDGFVYEHGPISFEKGKSQGSFLKLHLNPYSWSKDIQTLFISVIGNVEDCEDYGLVEKVSRCLQSSGLLRDGGIATSLTNTGQQWSRKIWIERSEVFGRRYCCEMDQNQLCCLQGNGNLAL